jgi:hypothetical protein
VDADTGEAYATWFAKVAISLQGDEDVSSDPAKTMNTWWYNNYNKIQASGAFATNKEIYKVSSWAIVIDITFKDTAPAFYSAVQTVTSVAGKNTGTIAVNVGCTANDFPAATYCLPEDATTNALAGVCKIWEY